MSDDLNDTIPTRERFFDKAQIPFVPLYYELSFKRLMGVRKEFSEFANVLRYLPNVTNSLTGRRTGFWETDGVIFLLSWITFTFSLFILLVHAAVVG
jgi:hypothetical protein